MEVLECIKTRRCIRKYLDKPVVWDDVSNILEALNLSGFLKDADYKVLDQLRKRRNETFHEGQEVTKEDAEKALNICLGLLSNMVHDL